MYGTSLSKSTKIMLSSGKLEFKICLMELEREEMKKNLRKDKLKILTLLYRLNKPKLLLDLLGPKF